MDAEEVEDALVQGILSGRFREDSPFPSGRALARELGTSVNTVLRAFSALRARGLVEGSFGDRVNVRNLVLSSRVDTLVELVLRFPLADERTRNVHAHLIDYLHDLLLQSAGPASRQRSSEHLEWLWRLFRELEDEDRRAMVQFQVAKVIVGAAGNLVRLAVLNAYERLFAAQAPLGPGRLILFPTSGRDRFCESLERGDAEGARRWVDDELRRTLGEWRDLLGRTSTEGQRAPAG